MELLVVLRQQADLRLTEDELLILNSALNEICNGISVSEFETRIGATRDDATLLLEKIGQTLDAIAASKWKKVPATQPGPFLLSLDPFKRHFRRYALKERHHLLLLFRWQLCGAVQHRHQRCLGGTGGDDQATRHHANIEFGSGSKPGFFNPASVQALQEYD